MIQKYSKKFVIVSANAHKKSFRSKIFCAFIFYDRELYFVSKCRQIKKLYCGIIKMSCKYGKKKKIIKS